VIGAWQKPRQLQALGGYNITSCLLFTTNGQDLSSFSTLLMVAILFVVVVVSTKNSIQWQLLFTGQQFCVTVKLAQPNIATIHDTRKWCKLCGSSSVVRFQLWSSLQSNSQWTWPYFAESITSTTYVSNVGNGYTWIRFW